MILDIFTKYKKHLIFHLSYCVFAIFILEWRFWSCTTLLIGSII